MILDTWRNYFVDDETRLDWREDGTVIDRQVLVAERQELGSARGRLLDGGAQHSPRADDEDPHAQRPMRYIAAAVR